MVRCDYCGKEVALPFKCKYCGGRFCVEHHLPENHDCPKLERGSWKPMVTPTRYSLEYEYYTPRKTPIEKKMRDFLFQTNEVRDLLIAIILVVFVYLSLGYGMILQEPILVATLALSIVTAFLSHELAHKYVALNQGFMARFRLDKQGAMLTAVSILLPIKIIAPGYVAIYSLRGYPSSEQIGKISMAGPLTNIFLALLALPWHNTSLLAYLFMRTNTDIAVFNLLPFGPLDGRKIIQWRMDLWALLFIVTTAIWIYMLIL
ncbi:MAG: hypothetical protein J7L38_06810 [Thermoproteales archaeon]|nr:hypothetical protein [Thermoproteales archaeon]